MTDRHTGDTDDRDDTDHGTDGGDTGPGDDSGGADRSDTRERTDRGADSGRTVERPVGRRDVLRSAGALPVGVAFDPGEVDGAGADGDAAGPRTVPDLPDRFAGWLAGDLHVHTHHSHDVCEDPTACEEPHTYGFSVGEQIRNAESRGLDYLAITDHNTVAAFDDPEYGSDQLTLLGGYEHSLANGHAGFFGVDRVYDRATRTGGQMRALLDEVHRDGGVGVANHPRTNISSTWEYGGPVGMDAVEIWSIAWYLREEPFQGLSSQNHEALALYDAYLDDGHRLAAVGGSDNHWVSTSWAQGPGQPTTWIHAPDGDEASLADGIRRNRTFVSWDWTGPQLLLEADAGAGEYDRMTGDVTEAAGEVDVRVTAANGVGHRLRLVLDGEVVDETIAPTSPHSWETTVDVPARVAEEKGHNWLRAEALLEEDYSMRALTSPIYFTHRGPTGDDDGDCDCHAPERREAYADLDL